MVRYSFLVRLSHPLLHAGLSRRLLDHPIRPRQHIRRNRQTDLLGCFQIDEQLELRRCSQIVFGPLLLTYGITLTILLSRLFSTVIWIERFLRNSSASSRAATVSKEACFAVNS